jgi:hypothetical protein
VNRKLVLLNLVLLALAAGLGWTFRKRWLEGQARDRAIFVNAARKMAMLPPPPLVSPKIVAPAEYLEVAQRTLFSKDRNPNVVIEPEKPKPEPPMPALPAYYGQMTLFDPVVFLALAGGGQKSYHPGDKVGAFELVTFDREKITLAWNGKTVERRLQELTPKEAAPQPVQAVAVQAAPPAAPQVKSIGGSTADSNADKGPMGVDMGANLFGCKTGDTAANGTVTNGYKKVIVRGLMGESCHWEQVK